MDASQPRFCESDHARSRHLRFSWPRQYGRFTKNNPGVPGNPHARQVAELRKRLLEKVTPEEMDAIIDAMLNRAREGDVSAAKLILQYTLGKPLAAPDPDRLDADEADAFFSNALNRQTQELAKVHPLELMLPLFRIAIEARGKGVLEQFAEEFVDEFGTDGQEPEREARRAKAAEEANPQTEGAAKPQAAQGNATPPVTVTTREQTATSLPVNAMAELLLAALRTPPPDLTTPATVTKPELPPAPPLPPLDAVRPQTGCNGASSPPVAGVKCADRKGHPSRDR